MFFIPSAIFLIWVLNWSIVKKDVPQWVHRFYYARRDHEDVEGKRSWRASGFHLLIMLLLFVSLVGVLSPFINQAGWLIGIAALGWFALVWPVMTNFTGKFAHYYLTVKENEKKAALERAYDAKNWATKTQISQAIPHAVKNGKPIGIHIGEGWHWYDKGHMLTVGGSGQGKGVNLVLPALLSDNFVNGETSVVCLDPKGENAAVAAPFLESQGYDVHVLNPFGIPEIAHLGNSRFNPFDQIDPDSESAVDLYKVMAMALHNRQSGGSDSFFDNRCRQYIALYMSYAHHVGKGNFDTVYDWLTYSGTERAELLAAMMSNETFEGTKTAKAILSRLIGEAAKTEEGIYSTIEDAIDVLNSKRLRASLLGSDFDMRTVAQQPTAIFICVPFEDLEKNAPWVRMFFSFLLRTLTKHYNPDRKVLVLLDEFPQLSYMDEVPRSSAVLRGYNVTLWPIVQNLGQLKTIYGDNWELFISSAMVKHWLSSGADNTTADYISHRMPQALKFIGNNPDGSPKERETKLLDPNQVMGFKNIICEISGMDTPAKFDKVAYWNLPFTKDNAADNPFYKAVNHNVKPPAPKAPAPAKQPERPKPEFKSEPQKPVEPLTAEELEILEKWRQSKKPKSEAE